MFARLKQVFLTFIAMTGWRLEHLSLAWVAGGLASLVISQLLMRFPDPRWIVPHFLFTLVFYYGGNTVILMSRLPARSIERLGEEMAFRRYESLLGIMFLNQGLGVGCMSALHEPAIENAIPAPLALSAGIALFAIGSVVKLWATLVVGVDVYYFRDMFVGRPLGTAASNGPYRWLRNPMYSVGQLAGYGYALLHHSFPGFCAAAAGHLLIYAFYFAAEKPFVKRVYPQAASRAALQ